MLQNRRIKRLYWRIKDLFYLLKDRNQTIMMLIYLQLCDIDVYNKMIVP